MSNIDYKEKYHKYKKKYLDLKNNIDQTSGSSTLTTKQKVMTVTLEPGQFGNKNDWSVLSQGLNDKFESHFKNLLLKEQKGKAVKYDLYLAKPMGLSMFSIVFYNEGDMLMKNEYIITAVDDDEDGRGTVNKVFLSYIVKNEFDYAAKVILEGTKGKVDKNDKVSELVKSEMEIMASKSVDYVKGMKRHFPL